MNRYHLSFIMQIYQNTVSFTYNKYIHLLVDNTDKKNKYYVYRKKMITINISVALKFNKS